jgi:site-specific DNA recombinase
MPVAVYARVSSEEQRERQSIETQFDFAQRFCDMHKLPIFRIFADDGISGTVPLDRRPEGSQILRDARLGKFDQLLVFKLDRLGRDTRLILNAVADLEKLGVRVQSMTEQFDASSAAGKLMLTMLSGFASHEREVIRERSVAGTNRVAESGAWLGGVVPYGYRKVGEKREAHLVVSEEKIPGQDLSEADVIRLIYRLAAVERRSCFYIAERLVELQVPCAYQRDDRLILRGKLKERTSGLWRPARVRNMIVSTTYKGVHEFGKRTSNKARKIISRPVPAIVDEATWAKAQETLHSNFLFGVRSTRNQYLLRGLMKCGLCNLTYIGVAANRPSGKREFYYRCNGAQGTRGIYGAKGERCPSKGIQGGGLEQMVWADVEEFLRKPSIVIDALQARLRRDAKDTLKDRERLVRLRGLLEGKAGERNKIVGLYRKGLLNDAELAQQLREIDREAAGLATQIEELESKQGSLDSNAAALESTATLLTRLRERLDQPLTYERKRQLVELLVGGIRIDTIRNEEKRENVVTVTYRFPSVVDTCTDTGSSPQPASDCTESVLSSPTARSSATRPQVAAAKSPEHRAETPETRREKECHCVRDSPRPVAAPRCRRRSIPHPRSCGAASETAGCARARRP